MDDAVVDYHGMSNLALIDTLNAFFSEPFNMPITNLSRFDPRGMDEATFFSRNFWGCIKEPYATLVEICRGEMPQAKQVYGILEAREQMFYARQIDEC